MLGLVSELNIVMTNNLNLGSVSLREFPRDGSKFMPGKVIWHSGTIKKDWQVISPFSILQTRGKENISDWSLTSTPVIT